MTSFRDEPQNPYDSPPIVATLVERPKTTKKRQPLLAVVFLILDLPLLVGTSYFWFLVYNKWSEAIEEPNAVALIASLVIPAVPTLFFWLVPILCAKELIQASRGR